MKYCVECGKLNKRPTYTCCSHSCAMKRRIRNDDNSIYNRTCKFCNETFQTKDMLDNTCQNCKNIGITDRSYKVQVDDEFFFNWSNDMAYAVGFITADGSIQKMSENSYLLSIGCTDKDIIEKLCILFKGGNIIEKDRTKEKEIYKTSKKMNI